MVGEQSFCLVVCVFFSGYTCTVSWQASRYWLFCACVSGFSNQGTSLVHGLLVWMQSVADLTPQQLLPIAESLQLLTACLSYPSRASFLAEANQGSSNMVSWSLGHSSILILPNHGRAVCLDSSSPLLNVQTGADPARLLPSDFLSNYQVC